MKAKRKPILCSQLLDFIQDRMVPHRVYEYDGHRKRFRFRSMVAMAIKENWDKGKPDTLFCIDIIGGWGQTKRLVKTLSYALAAMHHKYGTDFQIVTDNLLDLNEGKLVPINNDRRNKFCVILSTPPKITLNNPYEKSTTPTQKTPPPSWRVPLQTRTPRTPTPPGTSSSSR